MHHFLRALRRRQVRLQHVTAVQFDVSANASESTRISICRSFLRARPIQKSSTAGLGLHLLQRHRGLRAKMFGSSGKFLSEKEERLSWRHESKSIISCLWGAGRLRVCLHQIPSWGIEFTLAVKKELRVCPTCRSEQVVRKGKRYRWIQTVPIGFRPVTLKTEVPRVNAKPVGRPLRSPPLCPALCQIHKTTEPICL